VEPSAQNAPIACSLDRSGLAERLRRWLALAGRASVGVVQTPDGVRLSFQSAPGVDAELRELASLERECCAFANWAVRETGETLVLEVSGASPDAAAAVHEMFGSIGPVAAAGRRSARRPGRP
jgi:hypothetical protein